jgi:putative membrane protein
MINQINAGLFFVFTFNKLIFDTKMQFLGKIFLSTFAVLISAWLLPGVRVEDFLSAFLVAISLAVLNAIVKPILIILTIPVTIISLGLFLFVINAFIIYLADNMVAGFEVDGFWWAIFFSIVLSLVTSILSGFDKKENKKRRD